MRTAAPVVLLAAGMLAGQTIRDDDTPLRERCGDEAPEMLRLRKGTPVKLRVTVSVPASTWAAVTVEVQGEKLFGYVNKEALEGLDGFDEARRSAAATEARTASRTVAPKPVSSKAWPAAKPYVTKVPPKPGAAKPAPVPLPALPDFTLATLDDPPQSLTKESLKGKTAVLHFWASWCKPCAAQIEDLRRLHEKHKDGRFAVVTLGFDRAPDPLPWPRAKLEGGFTGETARRLGVERLPATILVDPEGRVVGRNLDPERIAQTLQQPLQ
jgi:thiol-disulfide isomerase/thioredoxin